MTHHPYEPGDIPADPTPARSGLNGFEWTDRPETDASGGQVVPLDTRRRARQTGPDETGASTAVSAAKSGRRTAARDTSYEIELDEEPPAEAAPTPVDLPEDATPVAAPVEGRRPIIPTGLHRTNLAATLTTTAGRWAHVAAFHVVRSPWYGLQAALWSVVGLFRLTGRQLRWWWVNEQYALLQQAATDNDPAMWLKLHREGKATRRLRGLVLFGQVIALIVAMVVAVGLPVVWQAAIAVALVPVLAHFGRPAGRPIIPTAVVTRRYRKLNSDIVLRAYYSAGLGHPDRSNQQIEFGTAMAREGNGSKVLVNLPYGKTFADAVNAREKIASGLDVALAQVSVSRDPQSHRSHWLWVADADPLATPAGRTPLLA